MNTPQDDEVVIERLRLKIPNAHIFKLPPKPSAGGWRGAEWRDKVWQGTLKVVERNDYTAVLLVDAQNEKNIFAICPITHQLDDKSNNGGNGVDRCIDSSRYFVLRIQNSQGRHMFIGLAFNERNDAFDFNTALEDSRREKMAEKKAAAAPLMKNSNYNGVNSVDYKMKEGEKIKVTIGNNSSGSGSDYRGGSGSGGAAAKRRLGKSSSNNAGSGGFLKPSSKDTPSRLA